MLSFHDFICFYIYEENTIGLGAAPGKSSIFPVASSTVSCRSAVGDFAEKNCSWSKMVVIDPTSSSVPSAIKLNPSGVPAGSAEWSAARYASSVD